MIVGLTALVSGASNIALADQDTGRAKAVGWLFQHQNGDGSWGQGWASAAATAEALAALKNAGADKGIHYTRAQAWLSNCQTDSVDSLARKIIALEDAGVDTVELSLTRTLLGQGNVTGVWGAYAGYGGGFPDSGLAMEALRTAGVTAPVAAYINLTTAGQGVGNQGWSYWGGARGANQTPAILPTASNITALSHLHQDGRSGAATLVLRAATWLLARKQSDGSFTDHAADTGSERNTASAYLALQAAANAALAPIGTDTALTQAATFLRSKQAADGSWSGDAYATALALRTFPATVMADADQDGIPDAVEPFVGTDPNQADGWKLLPQNGLSATPNPTGLSGNPIATEALANVPFSYPLAATGGTPGYAWSLVGGQLPPGIAVSTTEPWSLSGSPSAAGSYPFVLNLKDSQGVSVTVPGYLRVIAVNDTTTDTDGDGVPSYFELRDKLNPLAADTDHDGIPDRLEWNNYPDDWDTDRDGMPDAWEKTHAFNRNDPGDAGLDPDGDQLSNLDEFRHHSDPNVFDTDHDNLGDGAEVQIGRNPSINEAVVFGVVNTLLTGR
ncbi:putative Ig domain-containing protein [Methylomonas sp. SURF-2]|uniref:Ig domain-containing protein n=1 Tax=Methylomonas subterranea TaxID=2952225 RepID=A0ABT1THS5_9GAMM|nr:prenyltransferase/squalene oxidase repeat-containing protein [Methylomonas sp. SURF-2]MCQ8105010.1 putative Ig domain-containing protein [Methylomonas sp. SURF-2]